MAVVIAVALPASEGRSQTDHPPDEAVRAATEGRELYEAGRYEAAIERLQAAHDAYPAATLLANIARCHEELERWCEAQTFYERFLDDGDPDSGTSRETERSIEAMRRRCLATRSDEPNETGSETPTGNDDPDPDPMAQVFSRDDDPPGPAVTAIAGWTLVGIGLAAGAVGGGLWLAAYLDHAEDGDRGYRDYSVVGDSIFFPGVAMIVVGALLLVVFRPPAEPSHATVSVGPGSGLSLALDWP